MYEKTRNNLSPSDNLRTPSRRKKSLSSDNSDMLSLPNISQKTSRIGRRISISKLNTLIYVVKTGKSQGIFSPQPNKNKANSEIEQSVSLIMIKEIETSFYS